MTRKRKIWIGIGVVALIGFMSLNALRGERGRAVEVRVEEVSSRDLVARVSATGHIEPKTQVDITTDVAGRIVQLPVEEGQDVEEGDLLLAIDPAQYQAAVNRARAGLSQAEAAEAQARASYIQAQRDAERFQALQASGTDYVTAAEVERAVTQAEVEQALWRAAEHAVQQAQAGLDQAQDQLQKTTIRAPMSGRVTRLNVERGETAIVGTMNNPGSLLLTVADLSVMEAVIEVDETDVPEIAIGDSAWIEIDAFPNRRFGGRVTKIGNSSIRPLTAATSSSTQAIDFEVRITLDDPPPAIRPDLSATADVITDTRENVLAIPITALTLMDAQEVERLESEVLPDTIRPGSSVRDVEGVFLVEGERVRFVPVTIGIAGENYFEVLAGVELGQTVVSGSFQAIRELENGSRIEIVRTEDTEPQRGGAADAASRDGDA